MQTPRRLAFFLVERYELLLAFWTGNRVFQMQPLSVCTESSFLLAGSMHLGWNRVFLREDGVTSEMRLSSTGGWDCLFLKEWQGQVPLSLGR